MIPRTTIYRSDDGSLNLEVFGDPYFRFGVTISPDQLDSGWLLVTRRGSQFWGDLNTPFLSTLICLTAP
jgi:hypothetical protein